MKHKILKGHAPKKNVSFLSVMSLGDRRYFWLILNWNIGGKMKESKKEEPISLVFASLGNADYLDESAH